MTRLTANDAHDDNEHNSFRTYVLRAQDRTSWEVTFDTAAPAFQSQNAPFN